MRLGDPRRRRKRIEGVRVLPLRICPTTSTTCWTTASMAATRLARGVPGLWCEAARKGQRPRTARGSRLTRTRN